MSEEKTPSVEKASPTQTGKSSVGPVKKKTNQLLEALSIEIVIVLFILLATGMILNYFNIIPLSKNMPHIFGWLPHKSTGTTVGNEEVPGSIEQQMEAVKLTPTAVPTYLIACPVSPGFCNQGKSIYSTARRRVESFAFISLGEEIAVYAVFDGTMTSSTEKIEGVNKTTITLTGDNGFVASYIVQGVPQKENGTTDNKVKQSEIIAITEGGSIEMYDYTPQTYSLGLSIVNSENNQIIAVTPSKDGRALEFK